MNALVKNVRYLPSVIGNLFVKNGGGLVQQTRPAAFKSELNIKWIRPKKIPSTMPEKSGDGGLQLNITPQDYMVNYEKSKELQDADDIVKKIFTLNFLPKRETRNKKREETLKLVQRHKADRGSMESKLAAMTSEILHLQEHMITNKKNGSTKRFLKELIDKRKKNLGILRKWDYKRFEWVLEKLNLVYKPNPALYRNVTRKRSMRLLTKSYCSKLRSEKLNKYRQELESQQADFFIEKVGKLEFIRNEEIACGRTPSVTEDDINAAKEVAERYRKKQLESTS